MQIILSHHAHSPQPDFVVGVVTTKDTWNLTPLLTPPHQWQRVNRRSVCLCLLCNRFVRVALAAPYQAMHCAIVQALIMHHCVSMQV